MSDDAPAPGLHWPGCDPPQPPARLSLPGTAPGRYKWGRTLPRHGGHPGPGLISQLPARMGQRGGQALTNNGWASWRGCSPPGVEGPVLPTSVHRRPRTGEGARAGPVGSPQGVQALWVLEPSYTPCLARGRRQRQGSWHRGDTLGDTGAQPVLAALLGAKLNHSGWSWGAEPAWPAGLGYTGLTGTWKN